jgi:hypothetical protein
MPWTERQVRYLESSGSPLTHGQKNKMNAELHADPSLGHKKKGSSAMKKIPGGKLREMRIEVHHSGGKKTGYTVHHSMEPESASKSGAFMEQMHHSFPFGANQHEEMMDHVSEHLGGDGAAVSHAAKTEHDVDAVDDGRKED